MIRKLLLKILKGLLFFVAFILLYFLSAFLLSKVSIAEEASAPNEIVVYILTNGIHSDIVVPTNTAQENWFSSLNFLNSSIDTSQYKYLALGWGDKGFYLNTPSWSELKLSTALKATVGISGTAIHATYYKNMIESESCKKIEISKDQYGRLIEYIKNSFDVDNENNFVQIITSANKTELDAFYEAKGSYNIFNTCNSWTNKSLKYSGQKACFWTAFQGPIFEKYENK